MASKQEAYHILGLQTGATPKEIEKKYKQLSLEWHPQKHNYSALSNQKFKEISRAYVALTKSKEKKQEDMSMTEMLNLFEKAFFGEEDIFSRNGYDSSDDFIDIDDVDDDDDADDSDDSFEGVISSYDISGLVGVLVSNAKSAKESAKKAEQNADELIAEEEKEKQKAAKRKAKKKRRKLKKKQEKDSNEKVKTDDEGKVSPNGIRLNDSNVSASTVEEEGLDPNSAFVAVAVSKSKVASLLQNKKETKQLHTDANEASVNDVNPQVLQSRELAIRGNMMANIGEFQSAVGLFTDAIKLNPTEFKYFCNRSYCYHQLSMFDRALKDAERAILLQPTWPKGYFRKGQAQMGLQKYADAETCFRTVLSLDKNCKEAIQEVKKTQICQLMEMGFSRQQSEQALEEHVNKEEATEALLSGTYPPFVTTTKPTTNGYGQHSRPQTLGQDNEIYMSDEEDRFVCQTSLNSGGAGAASGPPTLRTVSQIPAPSRAPAAAPIKPTQAADLMDSRNPEGRTSLWVGNVKSQVTEKMISNLFSKYGEICSIRVLPDRRCAFVNYKDKNAAGKAMDSLQGYECCGEHFLIRFPNNTNTVGQSLVMKKKGPAEKPEVKEKLKGPVAGDECFFWRTSGCHYGNNCFYRHVKENKGIDNKFK